MKRTHYLFGLLCILVIIAGVAHAQTIGKLAEGQFVTCASKEESVKALTVLRDEGRQSFNERFYTFDCNVLIGSGIVKNLHGSITADGVVYRIVEVDFGPDSTRYWLTSQPIKGTRSL